MASPAHTSGIVLAGGRSSRFGADKLAAPLRGVPLLHHAVLRLAEVCDDVVVVLAPGAADPGLPPGVRTARDSVEGEGPLVGLQAGLGSAGDASVAVVAGGDMPDLAPAVLRAMIRVLRESGADAVALDDGAGARPLPCVLRVPPASAAAHALLHDGRRRLRDLLDALTTAVIDEPTWTALDPGRGTLRDVDTPGDLER